MNSNTYMCILRSEGGECEKPSPSEMEMVFAKYQQWQQKFSDNILDMGNKLGSVGSVVRNDTVTDGPFVEIKEIVGGYMLLKASSIEEATEVIKVSPMVENPGTSIEIRLVESR